MTQLSPRPRKELISAIVSPALINSIYLATALQWFLSNTTIFLLLRAHLISMVLLRQGVFASQVLLIRGYYASMALGRQLLWTVKKVMQVAWKPVEKLRQKLFLEFMHFVLGGGNGLVLLVFWPGWLFLGFAFLALAGLMG